MIRQRTVTAMKSGSSTIETFSYSARSPNVMQSMCMPGW